MAAPTRRVLTSWRLLERLVPSASSASITSRLHTAQNCGHQVDISRCLMDRPLLLASHCRPVCASSASPVYVPHRNNNWYTDKRISGNLGIELEGSDVEFMAVLTEPTTTVEGNKECTALSREAVGVPGVDPDFTPITDQTEGQELAQMVNTSLEQGEQGRLFAVVFLAHSQRKVTVEDVLVIDSEFAPTVGDRIRLEKVLMVGGKDFSLLGRPLLSREQVRVEATVIEKTLSHNRVWSTYKPRKRFRKLKLFRNPHTMLVINRIELNPVPEA